MIGTDVNHYQVVSNSLKEVHAVNDQTMISLGELQQRLNCLKNKNPLFANISFSTHVKELMARMEPAVVG